MGRPCQAGCRRSARSWSWSPPLALPEEAAIQIQLRLGGPSQDGERAVSAYSRLEDDEGTWILHASGRLALPNQRIGRSGTRTGTRPGSGLDRRVYPVAACGTRNPCRWMAFVLTARWPSAGTDTGERSKGSSRHGGTEMKSSPKSALPQEARRWRGLRPVLHPALLEWPCTARSASLSPQAGTAKPARTGEGWCRSPGAVFSWPGTVRGRCEYGCGKSIPRGHSRSLAVDEDGHW